MTKNTITTIELLKIGDIFQVVGSSQQLIKTTIQPAKVCKKLLFYAKPVDGIIPKAIRNKTEVIFIKKSKAIII